MRGLSPEQQNAVAQAASVVGGYWQLIQQAPPPPPRDPEHKPEFSVSVDPVTQEIVVEEVVEATE